MPDRWPLSDSDVIETVSEICQRWAAKTEPWATADLCEDIECSVNVAIENLPGASFYRWLHTLEERNARGLDYDSRERIAARLERLA